MFALSLLVHQYGIGKTIDAISKVVERWGGNKLAEMQDRSSLSMGSDKRENIPRLPKSVYRQGRELRKRDLRMAGVPPESEQKPPPAEPPSLAGCWLTARFESE